MTPTTSSDTSTEPATASNDDATMEALDRMESGCSQRSRSGTKKAYAAAKLEPERLKRGLFGRNAEKFDSSEIALVFAAFEKLLAQQARRTA